MNGGGTYAETYCHQDGRGCSNACDRTWGREDEEMQTMNFVGQRRGDFIQELSYKWVGDGNGEFEMVAPARKRPSYAGCLCLLGSLVLFGVIVAMNVMSEGKTTPSSGLDKVQSPTNTNDGIAGGVGAASPSVTSAPSAPSASLSPAQPPPAKVQIVPPAGGGFAGGDAEAVDEFDCDPGTLRPGEMVQAAFDISFRPAGFVTEGSLGRVAAVMPTSKQWIIVDWQGFSQLQGSKVSREQLVRALRPGDKVEAISEVMVQPAKAPDKGKLGADDLLFVTRDLPSGVPKGTAGYATAEVAASEPNAPRRFRVDFPEFPQFAGTEVSEEDVIKAPRVADHVKSVRSIETEVGVTVPEGSSGEVVAMTPERGSYAYKVQWQDVPQASAARISGLDLKVFSESYLPAPLRVPRGATGSVQTVTSARGLYDSQITISWDGLKNTDPAKVNRGQVDKVPEWPDDQREYCCRHKQVGCAGPLPTMALEPFGCDTSAPVWDREELNWCCQHRGIRCDKADENIEPDRALFNCKTREQWPQAKAIWCCMHESLGCALTTSHGP